MSFETLPRERPILDFQRGKYRPQQWVSLRVHGGCANLAELFWQLASCGRVVPQEVEVNLIVVNVVEEGLDGAAETFTLINSVSTIPHAAFTPPW